MTISAYASGTRSASVGTEHFEANVNAAGVYTFHVDLNNMQAGDYVELRVYQMILTGGTARVAYNEAFQGGEVAASEIKIAISVPISNELTDANSLRFSIKQVTGSSRNFDWKVLKH